MTLPLPSYSANSVRGLALSDAVSDLRAKDAIEPASSDLGFYSRLFVTPKVTGGWRPVIDLSRLNRYVRLSRFRMETSASVLQLLRPGDWMVSFDLQDTYLQVPVHPDSRRFLRFCMGADVFQFKALCFGLSSVPQVFTRVMAPVSSFMHRHGFRILRYLDDWLVLESSFQEITRARDFLLWLCARLGILVNLAKSTLIPSQRLDYLGMTLQSSLLRAFPLQARVHNALSLVAEFESSRLQPRKLWLSLLSIMSSLSAVVPGSRLRMRALQLHLHVAGSGLLDSDLVSWDDSCLPDLRWWSIAAHLEVGVPLDLPQPNLVLYTDASDAGWVASLGSAQLSGLWSPTCCLSSINHHELLAVFLALHGFNQLLRHRSVGLFLDNTTALAYLRKEGGTRSSTLNTMAQAILRFCEVHSIRLLPQFIPGRLNVLADALSRSSQVLGSEWTLCQEVCKDLFRRWPVTVDLFATSLTHRLPVYFSPVVDPQAAGVDAMLQSWDRLQAYAFPPFGLLPHLLAKVRQLTLVAPFWPLKPWFPDLLELLVEIPVLLPRRRDLLRQPHFHYFHRSLHALQLTGFRIASDPQGRSASLLQWLTNLPGAAAPLPDITTSQNG